ncbi:hypothetical protein [Gordonia soli]|uniref:Facilitated glucose transporter n=1 Tax=Gordonia soli NBRC 108243 TaxID=1223545 RepID=M0QDQ2_9ACTN|nr:hypothetical protein [Gordonia soli]GAC66441.1 hypothetical protein GS4_02_01520 [Gordonia soli NBRC 108243]
MRLVDKILLAVLTVDGLVIGILSVAFVYQRFGGVAWPVAAVVAGVLNASLLWLAAGFTDSGLRYAPLVAWLLALTIGAMPGPGGDLALVPQGTTFLPTVLLLVIGVGVPVALSWSGRLPSPRRDRPA